MTMRLAAFAPCPSSVAVRLVAASFFLAPIIDSVVLRSRSPKTHSYPRNFSLLNVDQVPGPTPDWVDYGPPEFTTFVNQSSACQACIKFFPEKQDGKRFHSNMYEDESGGVWERACRVGPCDFRDPQTQPVGGIIGKGVGPGGTPDGKSCLTRDPVPWYNDCEPIALNSASSMLDVTRYCTYKEQIFIPPPASTVSHFAGSKDNAWRRIGGGKEQCFATIKKQGAAFLDSMSFCDSDLPALSACCESVFGAFTCVAETAAARGITDGGGSQPSLFANLNEEGSAMLQMFSKYCVPLCQNTKASFCEKYPAADACVKPIACSNCTAKGGIWCPQLKSCHCPGPKPPCLASPITTPLQCIPDLDKKKILVPQGGKQKRSSKLGPGKDGPPGGPPSEEALCKYEEMARQWMETEDED